MTYCPASGACLAIEAAPQDYRDREPENGWGDVEGALEFLRAILRACRAAPKGKVVVWR